MGFKGAKDKEQLEFESKAEKKKSKQEEAFLNSLFKGLENTKKAAGTVEEDPGDKTVLCPQLKAGGCLRGDDCGYSHDINIEYNMGQADIYTDLRDFKTSDETDKINKIAAEKEGKRGQVRSKIICKYFMDAVKTRKYGWKWECPNGDLCHYQHCLPEGFVIDDNRGNNQEEMTIEEYVNLEERIDEERAIVSVNGTKVNEETFLLWKKRRIQQKEKEQADSKTKSKKKVKTGLELFTDKTFRMEDTDFENTEIEQKEEKEEVKIDEEAFMDEGELDELELDDEV